jgi:hypothetical protein
MKGLAFAGLHEKAALSPACMKKPGFRRALQSPSTHAAEQAGVG